MSRSTGSPDSGDDDEADPSAVLGSQTGGIPPSSALLQAKNRTIKVIILTEAIRIAKPGTVVDSANLLNFPNLYNRSALIPLCKWVEVN